MKNLLVNEYEDVSNKWYESFGNFVETVVVNPVKGVFGFMTGSWLKPLKDWMFGSKEDKNKKKEEKEEKDQGGPRITESMSKSITELPEMLEEAEAEENVGGPKVKKIVEK